MKRTTRELNVEEMNMVNGGSVCGCYGTHVKCPYEDCTATFSATADTYEEAVEIAMAAYEAHCNKYHKWAMFLASWGLRKL